ncbi:MAG: nicotinate (nicotinamide) nucleotide adenylyltransferase [Deltaproteobacteria bacterium]|nr:MAG: nicotinate (nicotinamide) nucleotide adenylyltransferase [Deltaproteobacteria bacterium]
MRAAIFGGSFDPPHVGHALIVSWLLMTERADRVVLVPVGAHPFAKELTPFDRRLRWCEGLARSLGPAVEVSAIEAELPPPNYTIHTLQALAERRVGQQLSLVVGADILAGVARWHRWSEIEERFAPVVVGRAGYPPLDGVPSFPEVSSTQIRWRLGAGRSVEALVPAAVLRELNEADIQRWRERSAGRA